MPTGLRVSTLCGELRRVELVIGGECLDVKSVADGLVTQACEHCGNGDFCNTRSFACNIVEETIPLDERVARALFHAFDYNLNMPE